MVQVTRRSIVPDEYDRYGIHQYDLSFMYSKHCDLACSFCMYSSSPAVHDRLNLTQLHFWLKTVRYEHIHALGLYGGEPWLFMEENSTILHMTSDNPIKFVITNGTWSRNIIDTTDFMKWVDKYDLEVFVSGTDQHVPFQDREVLEMLARKYSRIHLKSADTQILPMGTLLGRSPVRCTCKCTDERSYPTRIAVQPDGTIIYQSCDGVYPVIGSIFTDPFEVIHKKVTDMLQTGFAPVCPYYKERYVALEGQRNA